MLKLAALGLVSTAFAQPPGPMEPASCSVSCGTSADTQEVSITESGGTRTIWANNCPGFDWTDQSTPNDACEGDYTYELPMDIQFCETPADVGTTDPVMGAIGVSLSGIAIFGPADATGGDAYVNEADTFGACMSHPNEMGVMHYHADQPCIYNTTAYEGQHSPMIGVMVDGIPIYGYNSDGGVEPDDLDECNGHVDETHGFYHYHITTDYPYTVDCLRGYIPSELEELNSELASISECAVDTTETYDYSALEGMQPLLASDYTGTGNTVNAAGLAAPSVALLAAAAAVAMLVR